MKITMLGTSGSGKTSYMSAMSELFFYDNVNGYSIANRENDYNGSAFINKGFNQINSIYNTGKFPSGTSSSIIMPLELKYMGQHIIDIDWIDYRGGAIKELALGVETPQNSEIFAALMASDVVMIFVDAAELMVCSNIITARSRVGANEISQLLKLVLRKKHIDIIFILSKADSSIINIRRDFEILKEKIQRIYSNFFNDTNTSIADYPVIPVGAVGYGNVKTTYEWKTNNDGGTTLIFNNTINNFGNVYPVNVSASFACALLKCLDSESNNLTTQADDLAEELKCLSSNFGPVRNLLDILFGSHRRERIYDLREAILESRGELLKLNPHRPQLERIAKTIRIGGQ